MYKVYLNDPIDQSAIDRLKKQVEIVDNYDHPEELDAIIVRQQYVTRDVISRATKCKLIQMHGAGLDRIDIEAAKEYGIPVINTPGVNAQSVAEMTIAMLLSIARKVNYIDHQVRLGKITHFGMKETVGIELNHKKLGLMGSGNIAKIIAKIAKYGFDMEIYCFNSRRSKEELANLGMIKVDTIEQLMSDMDFVCLALPLTKDTYHCINKEIFDHCNPDLILVNTARGGIIDEDALYNALVEGKIKGAAIDTFEHEPPETTNPLFTLDNFLAGMHVAGSTTDALKRNGKICVDNVFKALDIKE